MVIKSFSYRLAVDDEAEGNWKNNLVVHESSLYVIETKAKCSVEYSSDENAEASVQHAFIGHFNCWHVYTWRHALQSSPHNMCYIASAPLFSADITFRTEFLGKTLTRFHISATAARLVYVNISRYYKSCCDMYRYLEPDLCPFQLMACAELSIHYPLTILTFTSHSPCNVFLIHLWYVTVTCAFREFTSDPCTSITNRLGLSLNLSTHNPYFAFTYITFEHIPQ